MAGEATTTAAGGSTTTVTGGGATTITTDAGTDTVTISSTAGATNGFAIAMSADQTIGTTANKFIGLGDTSGSHGVAAIPIPWDGFISTLVGRSLEVCEDVETIQFEIWIEHLGEGEEPHATGILCAVRGVGAVSTDYEGQGCVAPASVYPVHQLDLISVNVINDGCPSTQVSAVVGFASGETPE